MNEADRPSFPHLGPEDADVWRAYLRQYDHHFTHYEYDVHVGQGIDLGPGYTDWMRRDAIALTQKRIDVVAHTDRDIWIIELKGIAGVSAPGQVLAYMHLYQETYRPTKPLSPVLICRLATRDVVSAANALGVLIFLTSPTP